MYFMVPAHPFSFPANNSFSTAINPIRWGHHSNEEKHALVYISQCHPRQCIFMAGIWVIPRNKNLVSYKYFCKKTQICQTISICCSCRAMRCENGSHYLLLLKFNPMVTLLIIFGARNKPWAGDTWRKVNINVNIIIFWKGCTWYYGQTNNFHWKKCHLFL